VWCPEAGESVPAAATYSDRYPVLSRQKRLTVMASLTVGLLAAMIACFSIAVNTTGRMGWSFYVVAGVTAFYLAFLLPLWFRRPHPMIFVPVAFVSVCLLLWLLCWRTGGRWFWTFAFPLTFLLAALTIGAVALYRYVKRGAIFITGGLLMAVGGSCMLAELFQHLTFRTPMFSWSLYAAAVFFLFGGFLILAGIIRPLREHLERTFFI
jgi:hypothetical protein